MSRKVQLKKERTKEGKKEWRMAKGIKGNAELNVRTTEKEIQPFRDHNYYDVPL